MDPDDKTSCPNPTSQSLIQWGVDLQRQTCSDAECYGESFIFICNVLINKQARKRKRNVHFSL